MGLSQTISEIDDDFGRKKQIFLYLTPPLRVLLSKFCNTGSTEKKLLQYRIREWIKFDDTYNRFDTIVL